LRVILHKIAEKAKYELSRYFYMLETNPPKPCPPWSLQNK